MKTVPAKLIILSAILALPVGCAAEQQEGSEIVDVVGAEEDVAGDPSLKGYWMEKRLTTWSKSPYTKTQCANYVMTACKRDFPGYTGYSVSGVVTGDSVGAGYACAGYCRFYVN